MILHPICRLDLRALSIVLLLCVGLSACVVTNEDDSPPSFTLNVAKGGNGSVSSSPAGIDCGSTCSHSFDSGTSVTLAALPDLGYTISAWSGDCSGAGSCAVSMDTDRSVGATFMLIPPVGTPAAGAVLLQQLWTMASLSRPVHMALIPGASGYMVVVEQLGRVVVLQQGQQGISSTFLDLSDRVSQAIGEEGLFAIAFHPQYPQNRKLYVHYLRRTISPTILTGVLSELIADSSGMVGQPATERILLEIGQPFANHNGGQIAFGPDGMLYVALGDGGSGGDPLGHAQNRTTLLGTVLRLNVDAQDAGLQYSIPPDNPFVGNSNGYREEIWAWGLRNPWRFNFDRITGELFVADVGQNAIEEVNRIAKGGNYGWNTMEGTACFSPSTGCDMTGLELPITEYTHALGHSISGGFVYRGSAISALWGRYVFADFVTSLLWSVSSEAVATQFPPQLLSAGFNVSSFGQDATGELYVMEYPGGGIYKLVPAP